MGSLIVIYGIVVEPFKIIVLSHGSINHTLLNNMKKITVAIACIAMTSVLQTSCIVSKKKFDAETAKANKEHADNEALNKRIASQEETINGQKKEIQQQKNTIQSLNNRVARLLDSITNNEDEIIDLTSRIDKLGDENKKTAKQLNSTKDEVADQRRRLEQLQAFIDQQQKATENLRKKIADALEGFNSNELTITRKNGKVYISMQEGLLFPSGSAVVNPKGKEALAKVAGVLNTNTEVNINIEGHTDSLPIHTKQYPDNWSLSTARSTSIAHVLIDEYKVSPAKLIASGRSEYDPLSTNSTPQGRAANRRTEIILEPKLDELMKMLNGK
jgi:chemotaxis protein MotB